ncbi:MAG: FtsK/SpoIIIE domain-containing protein, partial [Rhodobacteraceae bacterium]|nr:FtsK/SpoIIIE domain-containing protein [Paracoccaceae bacterium]
DRFIEFNPHEEGNFSTALYNADAVSLAGLVAKDLEKRMNKNSLLRASLLITHDSPKRLREVYVEQNSRLGGGLLDEVTEGFLSRLRVGVGKGEAAAGTRRSNIDVVFLHEAYSKNATVEWEFIEGSSKELPEKIDFRNAALPRRRTDSDAFGKLVSQAIEVYMMASRPPRAAAQFTDLCYVATHETRLLADNSRIVPIKRVDWSNQEVSRTVERAHKMGEWVVSVDSMSSRQLLASKGISVIHDVQLPDVDMRILVSSDKPSSGLVGRLESNFASMHDQYLSQNAAVLADASIEMMAEVCSQKALSSAKSITTAWEIMGLVAAAGVVNFEKSVNAVNPVWFSLDDNQAFFGLQGRMADCIALAIHKDCQRFQVAMTVVEAKCIGKASAVSEAKKSREQIASTLATIKANFATQKDIMAKRAWGRHLLSLMSLRPDYIRFFSDNMELEGFRQAIAVGDVDYSVDGRSVVVIHDDVTLLDEISTSASEENDTVLQYTLGQRSFSRIIRHLREPDLAPFPHLPQNPSNYVPSFETQTAVNPADPHSSGQEPEEQFAISNQQGKTATEVLSTQDTAISEEEDKAEKDEIVDAVSATDEVRRNESLPLELENALQEIATRKGYSQQLEAEAMFAEVSAVNLQAALTDFGMTARFSEPRTISTPNGVLVGFAGHNTLTVAKLNQKLLELKTTHGLDVTDIRTGLGRISLFVAAQKRRVVDLDRVLLEAKWPKSAPLETSNFLIGLREDTGDPLWLNLRNAFGGNEVHAPHTLIAGETGSGKGVLTQNLLLQMIALNSPESLQLYLIDPKMGVDFPWISDAPHMAHDIITDQEEAEQVLNTIVAEMDRRYSLIKTKRVPKISEYNEIVNPSERLPYIVIIHDEMADWMASSDEYRSMIQSTMTRLASKARACGIHVVMITQRAAQDAIPPGIRDNLGNRLILKVANEAGSKLALGMRGAERLLGKGHLAARLAGDKPVGEEYFVAQVPFGTTDELAIYAQAIIANFKNA